MANEIKVTISAKGVITGVDQVEASLGRVRKSAADTQKSVQNSLKLNVSGSVSGFSDIGKSIDQVAKQAQTLQNVLATAFAGGAVASFLKTATAEASQFENALKGVDSVAFAFGQNQDQVKQAIKDFTKDGLINATDAALAFKQVLSTGTELPQAIALLNSLKDTASFNRQAFYSLGEAVIATTEGIKNGNSVRADAVGVTKNLSVLEKEYAASLKRTVGSLTDQEKIQARVTGFIREGAFAQGDAVKVLATYSGSISQLDAAYSRLNIAIGEQVTKSTSFNVVLRETGGLLDGITKQLTENQSGTFLDAVIENTLLAMDIFYRSTKSIIAAVNFVIDSGVTVILASLKTVEDVLNGLIRLTGKLTGIPIPQSSLFGDGFQKSLERTKKDLADITGAFTGPTLFTNIAGAIEKNRALQTLPQKNGPAGTAVRSPTQNLVEAEKAAKKQLAQEQKDRNALIKDGLNDLIQIQRNAVAALNEAAANPLRALFGDNDTIKAIKATRDELKKLDADFLQKYGKRDAGIADKLTDANQILAKTEQSNKIGAAAGIGNAIAGGADGARKLVAQGAGLALDALVPGLGQAAAPLLDALTQGPEAAKQMVKDFAKALPEIVTAFVEAIPVFIEEIANQFPVVVEKLAEKAPVIITALVKGLPKAFLAIQSAMPKVALSFATELIRNIPRIASEIASAIGKAIKKAVNGATGGVGDFFGNVNDFVGDTFGFKFAKGGEVPPGFPNDTARASLSSGEYIIDRSTTSDLKDFLANGSNAQNALLLKVIAMLEQPQVINSSVKLNQREFANIQLTLNRANERVS